VLVLLLIEISRPDTYLLDLAFLLTLYHLLLLLVLNVPDLISKDLHLLQPEVYLLAQLVV
jgi:hypothetical protein